MRATTTYQLDTRRASVPVPRLATAASGARLVWQTDPLLVGGGLFFLLLAIPSAVGLWLDPRTISGAPAWLKPLKFAVSTGVYTLTLAWIATWLSDWPRLRRYAGRLTVAIFAVELLIIGVQAWRGTASHFNVSTPLDAMLFSIMGGGIMAQTGAAIAVAFGLWRQRFDDAAIGWAVRVGMTVTIAGALTGGLMTRPTAAQLEAARAGQPLVQSGAHTVGAPDGGPGLPLTGWSTTHGDLRVPHFVGLHAMQALPLLALLVRRRPDATRRRVTVAATALYAGVFVLLLVQALRGLPVLGGLS